MFPVPPPKPQTPVKENPSLIPFLKGGSTFEGTPPSSPQTTHNNPASIAKKLQIQQSWARSASPTKGRPDDSWVKRDEGTESGQDGTTSIGLDRPVTPPPWLNQQGELQSGAPGSRQISGVMSPPPSSTLAGFSQKPGAAAPSWGNPPQTKPHPGQGQPKWTPPAPPKSPPPFKKPQPPTPQKPTLGRPMSAPAKGKSGISTSLYKSTTAGGQPPPTATQSKGMEMFLSRQQKLTDEDDKPTDVTDTEEPRAPTTRPISPLPSKADTGPLVGRATPIQQTPNYLKDLGIFIASPYKSALCPSSAWKPEQKLASNFDSPILLSFLNSITTNTVIIFLSFPASEVQHELVFRFSHQI